MHKLVTGLAVLALAALAMPAFAVSAAAPTDEQVTVSNPNPVHTRTNDCPGTLVWDVGMYDEYTPPAGCSSAASAGCFVNAINDGGFPTDGRRLADDFTSYGDPITGVKIWARYNVQGYDYHHANNGLHGFCVKFYAFDGVPQCPNGGTEGEGAIGTLLFEQYVDAAHFTEFEITTGVPRNYNACLRLSPAFTPTPGTYWVSVSADFDFTSYESGVTQWFWRLYPGYSGYDPFCESMWWDVWNTPDTPWNGTSIALNLPCWAGWAQAVELWSAPVATGACCAADGSCTITEQAQCNGTYMGDGTVCDPNPCAPATGACCAADGSCSVTTQVDCNGTWQGPGSVCVPNPCPPVPVKESSWGKIKNQYK